MVSVRELLNAFYRGSPLIISQLFDACRGINTSRKDMARIETWILTVFEGLSDK